MATKKKAGKKPVQKKPVKKKGKSSGSVSTQDAPPNNDNPPGKPPNP